jgi:hypothetical protein
MAGARRDGSRAHTAYRKAAARKRKFCMTGVYTIACCRRGVGGFSKAYDILRLRLPT